MAAKLIALILPLGLDTFAVAAALGASGLPTDHRLRISLLFTGFEVGMPLIGLALGAPVGRLVGPAADLVAIGILLGFGVYTLLGDDEDPERLLAMTRPGTGALLLGISISLDELAIGFTFGLLRLPPALVILLIGVQTFIVTQLGLRLGHRIGEQLREGAERLAGVALITLGLVLLAERLVG